jgi:hypothetical protein
MKFGILKSRIDEKLTKAFVNKSLKAEMKRFNKIVLEYKDVAQAYNIYHELSTNKGYTEEYAKEYLNECVDIYKNVNISKFSQFLLETWLKDIKTENKYSDVDNVLDKKNTIVESLIDSKKRIIQNLVTPIKTIEIKEKSLESLVENVNNTFKNYLETLNESQRERVKNLLSLNENEIRIKYETLSEIIIDKLNGLKEESSEPIKNTIEETLEKIKTDEPSVINLAKLMTLSSEL